MQDVSQNGEQKIILDYFQEYIGTFLDIGANDGITLSNTRALAELGWYGILVEPSPLAFQKLLTAYQDGIRVKDSTDVDAMPFGWCVNAAITVQDGPIDLYDSGTHLKKGDVALLSTTVPKEMDRWKKSGEQFTKTTVRGITFETLMKETGVTHFDFISIDAEGMDMAILSQIDLRAVGCRMLCIEYNASPVAEKLMRDYCAAHGMKVLHKNFENLIFTA